MLHLPVATTESVKVPAADAYADANFAANQNTKRRDQGRALCQYMTIKKEKSASLATEKKREMA